MGYMEIPVIGIGAGPVDRRPGPRVPRPARHLRRPQAEVRQALGRPQEAMVEGVSRLRGRGAGPHLPGEEHSYGVAPEEIDRLQAQIPARSRV